MVDVAQLVEPRIVIPAVAGSSPVVHPTSRRGERIGCSWWNRFIGPLAQLVEQLTLNQLVVGSIPTRPTIYPIALRRPSAACSSLQLEHYGAQSHGKE